MVCVAEPLSACQLQHEIAYHATWYLQKSLQRQGGSIDVPLKATLMGSLQAPTAIV